MAYDNIKYDQPSEGTNIPTDNISGVHYPREKITWGPVGTANEVTNSLPLPVAVGASAGVEGMIPSYKPSLNNTAQSIKASAGSIYWVEAVNPNTVVAYLKLYNTDTPTIGSPYFFFAVPPGNGVTPGIMVRSFPTPLSFDTAIECAATTAIANTFALSSNLSVMFGYK